MANIKFTCPHCNQSIETTFDMLGQGHSDKPPLFISQDDQVEALRAFSAGR